MTKGVKLGAKRGSYKKKIHKSVFDMNLIEWLTWIRCTSNQPRTKQQIADHKAVIDRFVKDLSDE